MESTEIILEVTEACEGVYDAGAVGQSIFTQGEDWNDLKSMVRDGVPCRFDDIMPRRKSIRLKFVRDEVLLV